MARTPLVGWLLTMAGPLAFQVIGLGNDLQSPKRRVATGLLVSLLALLFALPLMGGILGGIFDAL